MFNLFRGFAAQDAPPDSKATDSYFEKLLKYIPADIVAGYVAIAGILQEHNNDPLSMWLTWGVFGILLFLTPFYVCYVKTDPPGFHGRKLFHWVTACIAFTAWVFALGGPFAATFAWYKPYLGSVVLILTTLFIPVLEGRFVSTSNTPGNGPGNGGSGNGSDQNQPTPALVPAPSPSQPAPSPIQIPAPTASAPTTDSAPNEH